jgi:protein-L-isoaspartate O-methyltransferase
VARWLAERGASVVATESAATMIDRAKARMDTYVYENKMSLHHLDVTDQPYWDGIMATRSHWTVSS